MLTLEELDSLQVGDLVETYPLFAGLSKAPVVLRVVEVAKSRVEFVATWLGITLGRWTAAKEKHGVAWRVGK